MHLVKNVPLTDSKVELIIICKKHRYRSCHVLAQCLCMRPRSIKYGKIHWRCQFEGIKKAGDFYSITSTTA